jgi:DDE superfamily endonuclease
MRRRKRRFRNTWIAIRASPGGASTRYASRGVVSRRGSHRPEEHSDPVWGQTGSRPAAPKDLGFASAYVFGAVCPEQGKAAALIMPICNTAAMNHHLSEISSQVAADAHAVVILDGAGWHRSQGLVVPGNITLLELPPYSPELNPVERIWHYLRSHWLANSVFPSLADIMDACELAWNRFAADHTLIRSLCAIAWAADSPTQ